MLVICLTMANQKIIGKILVSFIKWFLFSTNVLSNKIKVSRL